MGGAIALFEAISSIKKDRLWWLALALALLNIGVGGSSAAQSIGGGSGVCCNFSDCNLGSINL